jgi:hypothetical protein
MKTFVILILLSFFIPNTFSQKPEFKKPDYKGIKKIIEDKSSPFYYPELFKRFTESDTTLTSQDFRVLYYGYLFNNSYHVFGVSDYTDSLNSILKRDSLGTGDYKAIIKYEKLILAEAPFNLRDLNFLGFAYSHIGDTLDLHQIAFKLNMIIGTILSTGDGKTEATAWHVISISHEYDILGVLGFRFGGTQSLTKKGCDYLQVAENDNGIKGLYFDVNMLLRKESELFK